MVRVLHEIKRDNVVWFYLRDKVYKGKKIKEKHLGSATIRDIADVLKPSLVSTRRILQIVGAWIGIGKLLMMSSDLSEARKDEYYANIIYGMLFSAGFSALHARINGVSSEDVINKLYLDALRSTVSDFKIDKMRAFGIPLTDETVNESLKVSPVRIDGKSRVTIPKYARVALGWKPGESLQPQVNLEKGEMTFSLVESKHVPHVSVDLCERFLELPEGFFGVCMKNNPLTLKELGKAMDKDLSMLSILLEDTPDIPSLLRKMWVVKGHEEPASLLERG